MTDNRPDAAALAASIKADAAAAASPIPAGGLQVTETAPLWLQAQGQLRIWLGPILGVLVGIAASRLNLPIINALWGQNSAEIVGILVTLITQGGMSAWQWARTRLVNSRWWHLAVDPRVPNELVRPADPAAKA